MKVCQISSCAGIGIAFLALLFSTGTAFAAMLQNNAPITKQMTTSQVKTEIKKKHKGRIIYIKRKATSSHPNCHIVKMVTSAGEFKYIRYACSR